MLIKVKGRFNEGVANMPDRGKAGKGVQVGRDGKGSTCSPQLCGVYSESLLHPDRLLSVSLGIQGSIAKAAAGVGTYIGFCEEEM